MIAAFRNEELLAVKPATVEEYQSSTTIRVLFGLLRKELKESVTTNH